MPVNDVVIASTTETQEQLDHAAGENWRKPFEPAKPIETDAKPIAPEADDKPAEIAADSETAKPESKTEADDKPETDNEKEVKKLRKRIDKLTAQKYSSESTNAELQSRLEAIERRLADAKPAEADGKKTPADGKPTQDQFKTYEDFVEALADWKADQRVKAALEQRDTQEVNESEQARTKEVFDNYNKGVSEAREEFEDFDEVVGREDLKIPVSAQVCVIEADNGPKIAYYLGQHPEICEKLLGMSDARVAIEIGKISASIESSSKPAPEVRTPAPKPATTAPAPIKPVGGTSHATAVPPGEMPFEDYQKVRAEERKNRYRR